MANVGGIRRGGRLPPQARFNETTQRIADLKAELRDEDSFFTRQALRRRLAREISTRSKAERAMVMDLARNPPRLERKLAETIEHAQSLVATMAPADSYVRMPQPPDPKAIGRIITSIHQLSSACREARENPRNSLPRSRDYRRMMFTDREGRFGWHVDYSQYPFIEARDLAGRQESDHGRVLELLREGLGYLESAHQLLRD